MIDANDIKGELEVQITIKKRNASNTFSFTIIGFKKRSIVSTPIVTKVVGTLVSGFISIDMATSATPKVANLFATDQNEKVITSGLIYAIVSASKDSTNVKDDFEIHGSTLRLRANKMLAIGTIDFVVSAKLTSGNANAIPSKKFSLIVVISSKASDIDVVAIQATKEFAIIGDTTKLPSEMKKVDVEALNSFPTTVNEVTFSATIKGGSINDAKGELTIILTITKSAASATKEVLISGFETTATRKTRKNDDETAVLKEKGKVVAITGDKTKLPSQMVNEAIKKLIGFPMNAKEITYGVKIVKVDDAEGQLIIILTITKNASSKTQNIIINGFKKLPESVKTDSKAVAAWAAKEFSITGDKSKLPSEMKKADVESLSNFPPKNEMHFSAVIKSSGANDAEGQLTIILTITKNTASTTEEVVIAGFKSSTISLLEFNLTPISDLKYVLATNTLPMDVATISVPIDQKGIIIPIDDLTYTIASVTSKISSAKISNANFAISGDKTKVQLKASIALPAGTYDISIKVTHDNGVIKTKSFTLIISAT